MTVYEIKCIEATIKVNYECKLFKLKENLQYFISLSKKLLCWAPNC